MPLCVTGMHRSGTSLMASWVQHCGVNLGEHQVGPEVGNEQGHFEDAEFHAIQSEQLLRHAPRSRGWQVVDAQPRRFDAEGVAQIRDALGRRSRHHEWGWKDPRSTLFLEHLVELVPDLHVVALWRPRDEVVSSLLRRSRRSDLQVMRIGRRRARRVWHAYNEALVRFARANPHRCRVVPTRALTPETADQVTEALRDWIPDVASFEEIYRPEALQMEPETSRSSALEAELAALSVV